MLADVAVGMGAKATDLRSGRGVFSLESIQFLHGMHALQLIHSRFAIAQKDKDWRLLS